MANIQTIKIAKLLKENVELKISLKAAKDRNHALLKQIFTLVKTVRKKETENNELKFKIIALQREVIEMTERNRNLINLI